MLAAPPACFRCRFFFKNKESDGRERPALINHTMVLPEFFCKLALHLLAPRGCSWWFKKGGRPTSTNQTMVLHEFLWKMVLHLAPHMCSWWLKKGGRGCNHCIVRARTPCDYRPSHPQSAGT